MAVKRTRKIVLTAALAVTGSLMLGTTVVSSGQTVDLRGKKGVVDPKDLKKHDPPPRSLHTIEPPSPSTNKSGGQGGNSNTGVNPTNGGLPPSNNGGSAVRHTPPPEKPKVVPPVKPPVVR
jgi:hypothetical protein